jgi:hypothetical protein
MSLVKAGANRMKNLAARPRQLYELASWKLTLHSDLFRSLGGGKRAVNVIDLARIERGTLATQPYEWAFIGALFSPKHAAELPASFPRDNFKTVQGYDGEKGYSYEARALVHMGADVAAHLGGLSAAWRQLAADLISPAYRRALTRLVGRDLSSLPMEVNVFRYPPSAWLGPHVDLKDKLLTHVFYFNNAWDEADGGCANILRSSDMADAVAQIPPLIGHSVVIVRSEDSWHAVARVRDDCPSSRLSMTVTFYRPGSISTMWPPGDETRLHHCQDPTLGREPRRTPGLWASLAPRIAHHTSARRR